MADLKVTVDYSELTGLVRTADQSKKALGLMARSFAAGKDQSAYMRGINQVVRAQKQLAPASRMSRSEIMKLGNEMKREALFANELAQATGRAAQSHAMLGKSANRAGVAMQQTGYQVGDFLVQIQSGTNPMVAFGQQATQLVGIMYLLPPATLAASKSILGLKVSMAGLALGLGIAIPLLTAIGAAFIKAKESADDTSVAIKTFEERVKAAKTETREMAEVLRLLKSGFETEGELALNDAIVEAKDNLEKVIEAKENLADVPFESEVNRDVAVEAAEKAIAAAREKLRLAREAAKAHRESADALEREQQAQERNASVVRQLHKVRQDQQREARELLKTYEGLLVVQKLQTDFAERTINMDKDSALYRAEEFRLGMEILRIKMKEEGHAHKNIESYIELLRQQEVFTEDALAAAEAGEALADSIEEAAKAFEALNKVNVGLDTEIAKVTAEIQALKDGQDASVASFLVGEEIKIRAVYATSVATAQAAEDFQATLAATAVFLEAMSKLEILGGLKSELSDLKGSLKGSKKETAEEHLDAIAKSVAMSQELVGVEKEIATQRQRAFDLSEKVSEMEGGLTDTRQESINSIVEMEAALRKATEAEELRKNQVEAFSDHMMDAMESVITGSKSIGDAFKDMLRNMLLDVYRQQVMQPIADVGSNFLKKILMADGGAFNKGVQMFADGGVVGSPTMFGHSGGLGVMGEAGPEAIMPLKRGPDGKLGVAGANGGNVTVNQTFQFTANGDESVKKIIAQAAPQIANMTQKQIMDSRRRGGQMKATFN